MKLFWCQGFFYKNFDYRNWCKKEFEDSNEKYGGSSEIGFQKIDY